MSFAESKATPVATSDLGLDRTRIDAQDQIQLIADPPVDSQIGTSRGFIEHHDDHQDGGLSKRKRLSIKAKNILHIGNDSSKIVATAPILADAPDTVSDSRLVYETPTKDKHTLKDLVHDPVSTVKSKVTGTGGHQVASNIAAKEISHGREVELVEAHDEIAKAKSEAEKLLAIKNVEELTKARQDMFVRWTMDRHVTKVRILPRHTGPLRSRKEFLLIEDGKQKMDWAGYIIHIANHVAERYGGEYIGFTDNPPAPTKEVLVPSVERLLVASAPFQESVMTIRRIYRWENQNETLKYLLMYLTLWIFDMVLPGFLLAIIYIIAHRKVRAPDIEDLRKDIIRTEDLNETALSIAEFIEKEGDQRWIDPLIDRVGPWLLVQLSDLANLMEILRNFYEWRVPNRTGISIGILAVGFIIVTITPVWLLVRASTFMMGVIFFGLFPISSHFPDYRLVASPVKWVFWKIPTHAEWAIKALQAEGARHREVETPSKPDAVTPDPLGYRGIPNADSQHVPTEPEVVKEYGSYQCRGGRFILNSVGVRYESAIGHTEQWKLRYEEIQRLEKITRHVQKNIGKDSGDDMKLVGPDGKEYVLMNTKNRDEAFSQIVGYSKVTWQVVW